MKSDYIDITLNQKNAAYNQQIFHKTEKCRPAAFQALSVNCLNLADDCVLLYLGLPFCSS